LRTAFAADSQGDIAIDWKTLGLKLYGNIAAAIACLLLTVLVATATGLAGYKLGLDDGYTWNQRQQPGLHFAPGGQATATFVSATGNYTIDGVRFHVQRDGPGVLNGSPVGYAALDGDIYIESGRSVPDVYQTCVHERLHQHTRVAPHRWIYDMDSRIVDETCLKLVYRLGTDAW
jgi:hypothetical protein